MGGGITTWKGGVEAYSEPSEASTHATPEHVERSEAPEHAPAELAQSASRVAIWHVLHSAEKSAAVVSEAAHGAAHASPSVPAGLAVQSYGPRPVLALVSCSEFLASAPCGTVGLT